MLSYIPNYSSKKGFPANHWNIESSCSLDTILAEGGTGLIYKTPPYFIACSRQHVCSTIGQEVKS